MGTVALEGVEFFAYHGVFEEEHRIGNRFSIDIWVEADVATAGETDSLADTVDYQRLYRIMEEVMASPAHLLEHIGGQIISGVRSAYPVVNLVTVKVSKLNPPIGAICSRASITMKG